MKCPMEMPDEKLLQFYLSNNPTALAALTALYKDRIYGAIYTTVKDKYAAEEIFRSVFVQVINNLMTGKNVEPGNFLLWANTIAQQMCIEYSNKIFGTRPPINLCDDFYREIDIYEQLPEYTYYEKHIKLRNTINMLPGNQREVMILNHYSSVSFRDISIRMKCSVTSTLDLMKHALVNIRNLMTEQEAVLK